MSDLDAETSKFCRKARYERFRRLCFVEKQDMRDLNVDVDVLWKSEFRDVLWKIERRTVNF